jgi:hypothetical protein
MFTIEQSKKFSFDFFLHLLINNLHCLVIFLFARNSFPSQSLKWIAGNLIMQFACKHNQCVYKRDTARRLHCYIRMTDQRSLECWITTTKNSMWLTKPAVLIFFIVFVYCVYVLFIIIISNVQPPWKYFVTVALETIFCRKYVRIFIINFPGSTILFTLSHKRCDSQKCYDT